MSAVLVVGLGNPGRQYEANRHNVGFMAADALVRRHNFSPWRAKFQGEMAEGLIAGTKVLALKPQTYMNLSGQSVAAAARFLKIAVEQVVVIHDELDLAPGRIRVKRGGGAGGHNGLKSIDAHLGANYRRVRIGIGHPGDKDRVADYVLHDFAKADQVWLEPLIDALALHLGMLLAGDEAGFMNKVTTATQPPKPKKDKPEEAAKTAQPSLAPTTAPQPDGPLALALLAAQNAKKG